MGFLGRATALILVGLLSSIRLGRQPGEVRSQLRNLGARRIALRAKRLARLPLFGKLGAHLLDLLLIVPLVPLG